MRTIAIINQKGGCGKTTTSINLAACLARLGQRALLVDMDPQGHCGVGLAVPEDQIERTIYDALLEERDGATARVNEIVWQIASNFDLAPSNIRLAAFEQVFAGRPGREDRLREALEKVSGNYDWAIIDCPPSVGLLTFNALRACDECLVPVETGFFSLHGLTKMMETLEELRDRCDKEILIRVLPTLYDTRTKLAREVLSELRSKFREYLTESTVNFNTKLKEAASFGQPITEYDPGSRGYKDFVNLARELMGDRPVDIEPVVVEKLSRPAELVQRAKQLAQLTNFQFGRNTVPTTAPVESVKVQEKTSEKIGGRFAESEEQTDAPEPAATPAARSTREKIDAFYGVKRIGAEVVFSARFEAAKNVLIAGDFNNWSSVSTPMRTSGKPGEWFMSLPLRPGRYRYRFIVDGQWTTDPHNSYVEANQFGELNNIVEVD
ncbi:MAG: AAA family ATPase [Phycisphaerales bacterium]|nr:AAA family ATPase [Phycisphaerales bacterium]